MQVLYLLRPILHVGNFFAVLSLVAPLVTEHAEWFLSNFWFLRKWFGLFCVDMEGSRRRKKGVDTSHVTAELPSDNNSFLLLIQEVHELCFVPFGKLFSLRMNNPTSAYIIWKGPKDFRCKNSTIE